MTHAATVCGYTDISRGYTERGRRRCWPAVNRTLAATGVIGAAKRLAEYGRTATSSPWNGSNMLASRDIRAGLPQIYLATREAFVAQMLNLDLLDGISFSKGCYSGQEIIARTQHLGRIAAPVSAAITSWRMAHRPDAPLEGRPRRAPH